MKTLALDNCKLSHHVRIDGVSVRVKLTTNVSFSRTQKGGGVVCHPKPASPDDATRRSHDNETVRQA